jgi:hypothetical protein
MPDDVTAQEQCVVTLSNSVSLDLLATAERMLSAGCDFEAKILRSLAEDMMRAISPTDQRFFQ